MTLRATCAEASSLDLVVCSYTTALRGREREGTMDSNDKFDKMIQNQRVLVFFLWFHARRGAA